MTDDRVGSCDVLHLPEPVSGPVDSNAGARKSKTNARRLFLQECRKSLVEGAAAWNNLSDDEKKKYFDKANAINASTNGASPKQGAQSAPRLALARCDDDDSDVPTTSIPPSAPQAVLATSDKCIDPAREVEADEGDDDDGARTEADGDANEDGDEAGDDATTDDGDDDERVISGQGKLPAAAAGAAAAAARSAADPRVAGYCALLVTSRGLGKRVQLSDFKGGKRGRKGIKGVKLMCDDVVVSLSVVLSDQLAPAPKRPREPWQLYAESQVINLQPVEPQPEPDTAQNFCEVFAALSEEQQKPFHERHEEDVKVHQAAVKARKKQEQELSGLGQILVCTARGSVNRVQVCSVDVQKRIAAGKALIALRNKDQVCSATLLSSVERADDQDRTTKSGTDAQQAPPSPTGAVPDATV